MNSKSFYLTAYLLYLITEYGFSIDYKVDLYSGQAIVVDGILNDEAWKFSQNITEFHNHFPVDEGLSTNQTEVKISHDGKKLYIAATYHDTEGRNNIGTLKRDVYDDGILLSDCFGVVLDPYNTGDNGYLFAINAAGVQYDALIGNINNLNSSWNTIWESKVTVNGNDKHYELAIPLDAINFNNTNSVWGIQFFVNDTKINLFMTAEASPRNFTQYDLRYTKKIEISDLPSKVSNKYSLQPAITTNRTKDISTDQVSDNLKVSLNGQYNISPSLRLDLTINPDFSQVEVDRQVTNLSRFAINFPERRKFFLENSDLFSNLGTFNTNPFYSRRIGSATDISYGAKISGNISDNNRIGILNTKTRSDGESEGNNYTVAVSRHRFNNAISATGYLVNTQRSNYHNRIAGTNLDYKSPNGKWTSNLKYSKAITSNLKGENDFFGSLVEYDTKKLTLELEYQNTGKNYRAETGFIPYQFNYDATSETFIKEGFSIAAAGFQIRHYPTDSKKVDWIRRFWLRNTNVLNEDNSLRSSTFFWSPFAIRFKNSSYVYAASLTQIENLRYSFDFLQNGNFIEPMQYVQTFGRVGYWSPNTKPFYYNLRFEYGQFYDGWRLNPEVRLSYRLLPTAVISASYEINDIDLGVLGGKTFHLARFTSEIYINNRLNWTTYFQYNTQVDNVNINSRIQWEYKPLSYVYLVLTNNYNQQFHAKNWGVSFKVNRRLDF